MKSKQLLVLTAILIITVFSLKDLYSGPRNIVMEFSTGTWCGFCPCGEQIADSILTAYPNTIIIGYHSGGNDPFVNPEATAVFNLIGYSASPTLCLDRTNQPITMPYSTWSINFHNRFISSPTTVVDVIVTNKTYNPNTRILNVTVNSTALQNLTGQYKIHFLITEDNMVYPQNFYTCGTPGYHDDYVHKWVPRTITNGATGQILNTGGVWNQNQTITKTFTDTLNSAWLPNNCKFIAMVFKDSTGTFYLSNVQQGVQQTVSSATGINGNENTPVKYYLSQNYPNPFNPKTNIKFAVQKNGNVTLKIYDILGNEKAVYMNGYLKAGEYNAEINASDWASGIYFYKLAAKDFSETKKMLLVK